MPHQQQAVDFIASRPASGVWLGVGAGKTITALSALQCIRPIGHILVIAPVAIARSTWLDEIEERGFNIRTRSLIVDERDRKLSKKQRLERIKQVFVDPPTMYFINQDLISRSPDKRCKVCHGDGLKDRVCTACQTGLVDQMPVQKLRVLMERCATPSSGRSRPSLSTSPRSSSHTRPIASKPCAWSARRSPGSLN
ncbi:conserved hypothetical protein [Arthrobacter sp. Hiyo1]|uniref:hypothetical protein n=1 Tax=Arthrobacter sp. Hiyo1 TaxID=1588020 RepID=UPI0006A3D6F6|nr:hypothetical protein [Arthrobacter sp. Hiyo1]GAP61338.1 conserved hypothetical protein [Arthrobacter sp. Hiyo1]